MSKSILFRLPSGSGLYSCINGELERISNVRLRLYDGTTVESLDSTRLSIKREGATTTVKRPDPPLVRFSLKRTVLSGWHNHIDNLPARVVGAPSHPDEDSWGKMAGKLYADFENDAAERNLFTQPFLALYAIRLRSGHRILPSVPLLMGEKDAGIPFIEGSDNFDVDSMKMSVHSDVWTLRMNVAGIRPLQLWNSMAEESSQLADDVEALDIFVSEPIRLYDSGQGWESLHRSALTGGAVQAWRPKALPDKEVTAELLGRYRFRLVSSIRIGDIKEVDVWRDVEFNVPSLSDLDSVVAFRPDYLQLHDIAAEREGIISGRRTLWDMALTLPAVPSPLYLFGCDGDDDEAVGSRVAVDVEIVKHGVTLHSSRYIPSEVVAAIGEGSFPRWLFFPDPDVRSMTFITAEGTFRVRMWPHPYLSGSFFWGGFGVKTLEEMGVERFASTLSSTEGFTLRDSYPLPSAIWRSGKGSGLFFPDSLLMLTDDSRVIAVVRAFRASGLVATTSPTAYLFTTSGIYLLKEMDDGSLRDAGLMATYLLRDADSIMVEGKTLRFISATGVTYLISGTTVKPLDENASSGPSASGGSGSLKSAVIVEPDGSGEDIYLLTRPIKRDDSGVKLWSVMLSGAFSREELTLRLFGSTDMVDWHMLAECDGSVLKGLYTPGLRYCRMEISGSLDGGLEGLELD